MEAEDAPVSNENRQRAQPPAETPPPPIFVHLPSSTDPHDSGEQTLQRLINGGIPQEVLVLSIEALFSSERAIKMVNDLQRSEAEAFVEAIYEVLERPDFPPHVRNDCVRSLYVACARHSLLPRSLRIELGESLTGAALCHGGFGDVWKREYRGQQVAVKVLKMYESNDLRKVTRRFCKEFITWKSLRHQNVLPLLGVIMSENRFAMVSKWMPNGDINQFVKAHEGVNRFELLVGVAEGLIYMHERRMVHGDLKGANILIDENGRARLADFGLLAIASDTTTIISSASFSEAGTHRWMSPELLDPERFRLEHSRPTKPSDCYALGMVVYEVLSGNVPFYRCGRYAVAARILEGERPERPQGAAGLWFTDEIWSVLERCWKTTASDRPRTADVLLCLKKVSGSWPPSQTTNLYSSAHDNTDKGEVPSPPHAVTVEPSRRSPSVIVARESHDPVVPRGTVKKAFSGDGEVWVRLQTPSGNVYTSFTSGHQMKCLQFSFFFFD
ncbi:kinase-like domain-containing protein [Thelephora terrestris]|uniref:Kinase-like domain-containing protein n=1 Tax=Thelephora terrestris TaxID=56493 RepID=A0A9P6L3D1_9AGAM|nr:kinase-like domain-containing protein [Thelephora terrestris]